MKLNTQKRLAGSILKCSPKRVTFDPSKLNDIKEAITKADLKTLVNEKTITKTPARGISRFQARERAKQRSKGLQKGAGKRRAKQTARVSKKESWMQRIRIQRSFLKELKVKAIVSPETYKNLYRKTKGGFFRSKRHIKGYVKENELALIEDKSEAKK